MTGIRVDSFGGIAPAVEDRLLDPRLATRAHNVDLRRGDFRPLPTDVAVATAGVSNPQTLYRFARVAGGGFNSDPTTGWIVKAGDVDFARGPIPDDANERTYYTGDGAPKATDLSGVVRTLGVPAPVLGAVLLETNDEFTNDERSGAIDHMIDTIDWCIRLGLPSSPQWFGATNAGALSLTQRTTANGFTPEHPIQVVKGIAGTGTTLTDPANYAFLLDPKLDGFWNGTFYCIPICAYGYAGEVSGAMETNLANILDPSTESVQFLTTEQIDSLRDMVDGMFNLDDAVLKGKSAELSSILKAFDTAVSNGLGVAKVAAVTAFYARSDVTSLLSSARTTFAEEVYGLANRIMEYVPLDGLAGGGG